MKKVPVQKGSIVADQMTMKTMTKEQVQKSDSDNHDLRRSGQRLTLHEPKKGR